MTLTTIDCHFAPKYYHYNPFFEEVKLYNEEKCQRQNMTSTGTNIPLLTYGDEKPRQELVEFVIYEQIGMTTVNLPQRQETQTVSNAVSVDDDALWEWSDYESDPNLDWHGEFVDGEFRVCYEQKFCVIGFKPKKGNKFISKNNDSDMAIFGVKHEGFTDRNKNHI
jgi:hypothetical protein